MSSRYYRRDGTPTEDIGEAFGGDKHVASDYLDEGFHVSTVHLGLDHAHDGGPPLIFETMVFKQSGGEVTSYLDLYCDRYSTEAEAAAGHARVVAAIQAGTLEMYGLDEAATA